MSAPEYEHAEDPVWARTNLIDEIISTAEVNIQNSVPLVTSNLECVSFLRGIVEPNLDGKHPYHANLEAFLVIKRAFTGEPTTALLSFGSFKSPILHKYSFATSAYELRHLTAEDTVIDVRNIDRLKRSIFTETDSQNFAHKVIRARLFGSPWRRALDLTAEVTSRRLAK